MRGNVLARILALAASSCTVAGVVQSLGPAPTYMPRADRPRRMQANTSRRAPCACGAEGGGGGEGGGEGSSTKATSLPLVFSNLLAQAMSVEKEAWTDFDQVSYEAELRRRIERDVLPEPEDCTRWLAASPRIEQARSSSPLPLPPPPPPYPPPRTPPSTEVPCSE